MRARTVNLTEEQDRFVDSRVESGMYQDASDVMRSALRLLEREEREHESKVPALQQAIRVGDASPDAEDGAFDRLYQYLDQLSAAEDENVA